MILIAKALLKLLSFSTPNNQSQKRITKDTLLPAELIIISLDGLPKERNKHINGQR